MQSISNRRRVSFAVRAGVVIFAVTSFVRAQEPTLYLPDRSENQTTQSAVDSIHNDTPVQNLPAPCDSGFWFVNTHHSPQSFNRSCPRFRPGTLRYDECAGFRQSSCQEMMSALHPGVPVCIMIHGSFMDSDSAHRESVCTWKWLRSASEGLPMQMIYFHWPSHKVIGPALLCDINILGKRAARNGYYLAEMIQHLPPESPVCLIGHSHGTRVAAAGLHLMAGGTIQRIGHPYARANGRPVRTVFVASAIDHDWLNPGHKYDRALCSTQCLLNMTNHHDVPLSIYPLRLPLISRRALGCSGLTRWDRNRLGGRSRQVLDYDVSPAIGRHHLWPYYFRNVGLAMAMRNYVYFPDHIAQTPIAAANPGHTTQ